MQAIITKYHGPTERRGSRVSATSASGNRLFMTWDNALRSEANHKAAAQALCAKLQWRGPYAAGCLKNGDMVWIQTDTTDSFLA